MGWSTSDRAKDMQREHQANADRNAQAAASRRVSADRMKRAILKDDAKRSK
jgi:hypothetical protein